MFGNFFLKSLNFYIKKIEKIGLGPFRASLNSTLGNKVV